MLNTKKLLGHNWLFGKISIGWSRKSCDMKWSLRGIESLVSILLVLKERSRRWTIAWEITFFYSASSTEFQGLRAFQTWLTVNWLQKLYYSSGLYILDSCHPSFQFIFSTLILNNGRENKQSVVFTLSNSSELLFLKFTNKLQLAILKDILSALLPLWSLKCFPTL